MPRLLLNRGTEKSNKHRIAIVEEENHGLALFWQKQRGGKQFSVTHLHLSKYGCTADCQSGRS